MDVVTSDFERNQDAAYEFGETEYDKLHDMCAVGACGMPLALRREQELQA